MSLFIHTVRATIHKEVSL